MKLYKGSATPVARTSPYALYDRSLAGFGESGGEFSQAASPGFIELFTLQSRMAHRVRDGAESGRRGGSVTSSFYEFARALRAGCDRVHDPHALPDAAADRRRGGDRARSLLGGYLAATREPPEG